MIFVPNGVIPPFNDFLNVGSFNTNRVVGVDVTKCSESDLPEHHVLDVLLDTGHTVSYLIEDAELVNNVLTYFRHIIGSNAYTDIPYNEYHAMVEKEKARADVKAE